nr:hypothetical protein BdHM001_15870 [Bdellovibrio sp. HM001]
MKTKVWLLFLILSSVGYEASAGMFTWRRWTPDAVKVCFANPVENSRDGYRRSRWKAEDKAQVRRWVEDEFTPARTGIHFVGFHDCVPGEKDNVIINFRPKNVLRWLEGTRGSATIGYQLFRVSKDFPNVAGNIHFFVGGLRKSTVIHEFGHIAGLYHEHDHPHSTCSIGGEKQEGLKWGFGYTEYDPNSVMSYCVSRGSDDRGLSAGDLFTLKLMYIDRVNAMTSSGILR